METDRGRDFDEIVESYKYELRQAYVDALAISDNKKYAQAYYKQTIFENNPKLPQNSYFFDRLSRLFLHNYRLNQSEALLKTFDDLHEIRERAEVELAFLEETYKGLTDEELGYLKIGSLSQERQLLNLEWFEISDLLALLLATRELMTEVSSARVELFGIDEPLLDEAQKRSEKYYEAKFSEHHQVFAIYYLLKYLGIAIGRDTFQSDFARFIHLLTGHNITSVYNQNKLKILKKLTAQNFTKNNLQDFHTVRHFFRKINFDKVCEIIEKDIEAFQEF